MTDTFDKSWFDKISFNMSEYSAEQVGVHVFKRNQECRLFMIGTAAFESADLWRNVYDKALKVWSTDYDIKGHCQNCGMLRRLFERRYQNKRFCGWCGEKL